MGCSTLSYVLLLGMDDLVVGRSCAVIFSLVDSWRVVQVRLGEEPACCSSPQRMEAQAELEKFADNLSEQLGRGGEVEEQREVAERASQMENSMASLMRSLLSSRRDKASDGDLNCS